MFSFLFLLPISAICFITLLFFLLRTEDPCSTKQCPFYSECTLDENREAQCTCVQRCSLIFAPVCGSDGETYPNKCVLRITSCTVNGSITLLHQGHCSEFRNLLYSTSFFNFFLLHRSNINMPFWAYIKLSQLCGAFFYFS